MKLNLVDSGGFFEQPQWWQNFINDVDERIDTRQLKDEDRDLIIFEEFYKIGAKVVGDLFDPTIPVAIEFEDDKLATWFLLRWS